MGSAAGSPTPANIRSDGEAIIEFLREELKLQSKIGVYGRSLGGIVATHLARVRPDVDFVMADRTLANLDIISERKAHGRLMSVLFKIIMFAYCSDSWRVRSDMNFYESGCDLKIMTADPNDDVVDTHSSLMTGVALCAV